MLKDEINLMLSSLINNKKAFKKFYRTGYFSYSKDKLFKGAVAIVNDKAIMSFLQDVDDDSKVIATATFQDNNTTIIIQLNGEDFSRIQFGNLPCKLSSNLKSVINDISSVCRHCDEAKRKLICSNQNFIKSIFSKISQSSYRNLSKQDIRILMETTLDKLHETRNLHNRNEISPKVETTNFETKTTSDIQTSINNKTLEI